MAKFADRLRPMTVQRSTLVDTADRLALVASGACLLHCLALPLLFAALPILSQALSLSESFHLWMVAVAVPTSAYALLMGVRGHYGGLPVTACNDDRFGARS